MLRPDAWVVKPGRYGIRVDYVAVCRLEKHRLGAMENAETPAVDRRSVFASRDSLAGRLDADELYVRVVHKSGKESDGIGTTTDARNRLVRKPSELLEALATRLLADDGLEVLHHLGIRIGACRRTDNIESVVAIRDPVAESFIHRVLQSRAALFNRMDCRAKHLHALDIWRLALHVDCAHVDLAGHPEKRGDCRRRDAVHPSAGFCDQALFTHALS